MISPYALVQTDHVGQDVTIDEFAIVRRGAIVGNRVHIHPHAVLDAGVVLEDDVEVWPGAFIGKVPKSPGTLTRTPRFERTVRIGARSQIGPHSVIYYGVEVGVSVLIGEYVSIREGSRIGARCIIGPHCALNYDVVVGDDCQLRNGCQLGGGTQIGSGCFVSPLLSTVNTTEFGRRSFEAEYAPVVVEPDCRIGPSVTLLPGTVVGRDAVVGAGSVVTRAVAPRKVVFGAPARERRDVDDPKEPEC